MDFKEFKAEAEKRCADISVLSGYRCKTDFQEAVCEAVNGYLAELNITYTDAYSGNTYQLVADCWWGYSNAYPRIFWKKITDGQKDDISILFFDTHFKRGTKAGYDAMFFKSIDFKAYVENLDADFIEESKRRLENYFKNKRNDEQLKADILEANADRINAIADAIAELYKSPNHGIIQEAINKKLKEKRCYLEIK